MWLNQRRAWRNLAGGGTPTATNIATSACEGTYLGGTEGKERRKVVGAGRPVERGEWREGRSVLNTWKHHFVDIQPTPQCSSFLRGNHSGPGGLHLISSCQIPWFSIGLPQATWWLFNWACAVHSAELYMWVGLMHSRLRCAWRVHRPQSL